MVVPYEGKAEYGEEGEDEGEDGGEVVPQVGRVRHVHQAHHLRVYSTVCTYGNSSRLRTLVFREDYRGILNYSNPQKET